MSRFSGDVDYHDQASAARWRLMVWDVPASLGGLLSRLGFKPTKKNPDHWWRVFNSATERDAASEARLALREAGLSGSWTQVYDKPASRAAVQTRKYKPFKSHADGSGFGGKLNARPSRGSWRRKTRHP